MQNGRINIEKWSSWKCCNPLVIITTYLDGFSGGQTAQPSVSGQIREKHLCICKVYPGQEKPFK